MERTYLPVNLPSKCKTYGVDPKQIQISAYTGGDEVYIAEISIKSLDEKFAKVLDRCLKGIDPRQLTIGDRTYLMVWLCANSYSNLMVTMVTCPYCGSVHQQQCDLFSVNSVELPDDYVEPKEITLSDGTPLKLKLTTVGDQIEIDAKEKDGFNSWLYRWARSIVNGKSPIDNMKWLESRGARDVAVIRGFHEKYQHGPDMKFTCKCNKCGEESVEAIPFRLEWFLPSIS